MKRKAILAVLLIFSTVLSFAQTYSLKTADGEKCTVTLDGDFVSITEPFFGGYLNKIVIPKKYFHSTSEKILVSFEEGARSVINNPPYMETHDSIFIIENKTDTTIMGFLSGMAVYHMQIIQGIWLYKKDVDEIARKLGI